jgi:hypothetical protein
MANKRRTIWLGGALAAVLVVAGIVWTSGGSAPTPTAAPAGRAPRGQAGQPAPAEEPPGHVQLEALKVERTGPGDAERNPFRFESRAEAQLPAGTFTAPTPVNQGALAPVTPVVPAGPPPPPPIPLKFIGVVTQGDKRVAVLSDGKSPVSGTEGAIILGQYRILKIGAESIEMSYVDGRGRQTIRLTGQ